MSVFLGTAVIMSAMLMMYIIGRNVAFKNDNATTIDHLFFAAALLASFFGIAILVLGV